MGDDEVVRKPGEGLASIRSRSIVGSRFLFPARVSTPSVAFEDIAEGVVCAGLWLFFERYTFRGFSSEDVGPPRHLSLSISMSARTTPATPASSVRAFRASLRRAHRCARTGRTPVRSAPAPRAAFDATGDDDASVADGSADLLSRLHVNFLALRRGSRFAAQEFAIVATEAYERGVTMPSLRMDISLLGLSTASDLGLSEQDAFLSHLGMCMMTLWELDWPSTGGAIVKARKDGNSDEKDSINSSADKKTKTWSPIGNSNPEDDKEARGLLAYIRATHQRSDAGYTLKRMEMERLMTLQARSKGDPDAWDHPEGWRDTQRLDREDLDPENINSNDNVPASRQGIASRGGPESGPRALGETDAVKLMRVNCRLTLLLREFVFSQRGLRPVAEVISTRDEELDAIDFETKGLTGKINTREDADDDDDEGIVISIAPQVALEWSSVPRDLPRTLAARLLVSYVSCLTSHPVGLRQFVSATLDARAAGISAADLANSLDPAEFDVEGSRRGMFGSSADAGKFFALFLTSAYVAADEDDTDAAGTDAGVNDSTKSKGDDASVASLDPDMFAWCPAPGEDAGEVGWAAVSSGAMTEEEADEAEERRRRSVAGMRASVRAWMSLDRAQLKSSVAERLSMDEDDPNMSQDDEDDITAEFASASKAFRSGEMGISDGQSKSAEIPTPRTSPPPGDIPWRRDDLLTANSATIAALTIQRAVVSFTLAESARRRQ